MTSSLFNISTAVLTCTSSAIPYPTLFGAEFLSMETNLVQNYTATIHSGLYSNHGGVSLENVSYCNVTVSYTHPGQNDTIFVQTLLPATAEAWNGRLQMIGGSGFQAGLAYASLLGMKAAVGEGYSTVGTDAGLGSQVDASTWGLLSPGNVNLYLLQNLGSVSLNDAAVIGKAISASYYGQSPKYSYFTGCSQGGRQGMMLAQRYPDAFDGIASSAPAINWNDFFVAMAWPLYVMSKIGEFPPSCEFDAITDATIAACDGNDGLVDGIVSDPNKCFFDPMSMVGKTINCTNFGTLRNISFAAAQIVQATEHGPIRADNSSTWFGVPKGVATLTGSVTDAGILPTICSANETCVAGDFQLSTSWIRYFIEKNATADINDMSLEEFGQLAHKSKQMYDSMIGTNDPDLSEFKARGGKIVGYHGLADTIITPNGTLSYYDKVTALDPDVHDFYRMFLAPGISHCYGGQGAYPAGTFDSMRKWVEEGIAPETLNATSDGATISINRPLCPYPKLQYFNGTGDGTTPEGFYCQ